MMLLRAFFLLMVLAGMAGCGDDEDAATAAVVVGVTSDYRPGTDIDTLSVEMTAGGAPISSQTLTLDGSSFPLELTFEDVAPGTELSVRLEASVGSTRRVVRDLTTRAGGAGTRGLVQVRLERLCDQATSNPDLPPLECDPGLTCVSGSCRSPDVPVNAHEPYRPDWSEQGGSDICKEPGGTPEVIVGQGQSDFFIAEDSEVIQVEAGPQGGYHVWISARIKNLRRSGTTTEVTGRVPSLGVDIPPLRVIFTFDPDEGGYCKIFGLRFRLDEGADIQTLLGETVDVTVTMEDSEGTVGTDSHRFVLSDDIL